MGIKVLFIFNLIISAKINYTSAIAIKDKND
jgi:hypothetical protein